MLAKHGFSFVSVELGEPRARGGKLQFAVLEFGKLQDIKRVDNGEKIIDLKAQRACKLGEIRLVVVGRRGNGFEQAGHTADRGSGQGLCDGRVADFRFALSEDRIDLIDQFVKARVLPISW